MHNSREWWFWWTWPNLKLTESFCFFEKPNPVHHSREWWFWWPWPILTITASLYCWRHQNLRELQRMVVLVTLSYSETHSIILLLKTSNPVHNSTEWWLLWHLPNLTVVVSFYCWGYKKKMRPLQYCKEWCLLATYWLYIFLWCLAFRMWVAWTVCLTADVKGCITNRINIYIWINTHSSLMTELARETCLILPAAHYSHSFCLRGARWNKICVFIVELPGTVSIIFHFRGSFPV